MAAAGREDAASQFSIRLFGPLEICLNGRPLPRLRFRKSPWLLALLALRSPASGYPAAVERDWLLGLLWPESCGSQALRNCLTELRRALGEQAGRLRSPTPYTLSLDLTGADVDLVAFDSALARGDPAGLAEAVLLYRGPLLEGCCEEWAFQERQAREQGYLAARERLAALALERGEATEAERHLRLAVGTDPLRESTQRALMQVLAAGGNYAAALLVYRDLRIHLHRELNTEPDAETQALFQQLRSEARRLAAKGSGTRGPESEVSQGRSAEGEHQESAVPEPRPLASVLSGTVTFLFTDIEGSSRLWEEQPEAMRVALARHDALLRAAIERQRGQVFKTMGDQFCAAFANASDALAAALAAQRAVSGVQVCGCSGVQDPSDPSDSTEPERRNARTPERLKVRMALHTGAAEARDGDYFGPPLNRVARLLEAGHGGQVLLSQAAADLVRDALPEGVSLRDLGEHRLKDLVRPEQVFQALAPDLPAVFLPLNSLDARVHNLPVQRAPLIGREAEVARALELLRRAEVGLLTLTGAGGSGKTRLGLQIAAGLLREFEHGVFLVELAPIRDPALVLPAIARSLGVQELGGTPLIESVQAQLKERQLLLLLDNFEQVVDAAPLVTDLLSAAPRLKVLVTSRTPLRLRGEKELAVPPLAVPGVQPGSAHSAGTPSGVRGEPASGPERPNARTPERLMRYAAVELFVQRAQDAQPEFALTAENAPAIAAICARLEGLPLALELAAARIKVFPPKALLARLEGSPLRLLTGGARDLPDRQRTLWNAIAWSYDLLGANEQRLFERLSVFSGGCTLEAAEALCTAVGDGEVEVAEVSPPWWITACCARRRGRTVSTGFACWRRSGSSGGSGWRGHRVPTKWVDEAVVLARKRPSGSSTRSSSWRWPKMPSRRSAPTPSGWSGWRPSTTTCAPRWTGALVQAFRRSGRVPSGRAFRIRPIRLI